MLVTHQLHWTPSCSPTDLRLCRLQAAGQFFTSCQDVLIPKDAESAPLAALAIEKGVFLQRYVETCRACLHSTC